MDAATPAHIYSGHLISLRRYAWQKRERCDFDKVILDTLAGLRYLHSKDLVHMELTQDTLTVSKVCISYEITHTHTLIHTHTHTHMKYSSDPPFKVKLRESLGPK